MVRDWVVTGRLQGQTADTASFCVNSYTFAGVYMNHMKRAYDSSVLLQEVSSVELLQHRSTLAE